MSELQIQKDLSGKSHFIFSGESKKGREYPQDSKKKTGLDKYQTEDTTSGSNP